MAQKTLPKLQTVNRLQALLASACAAAVFATVLTSLLAAPLANSESLKYYRVINDRGAIELKSAITPAEAKRGYAIVGLGGNVIKEVPAELSDEEYAVLSEGLKQRELAAKRKKEQRDYNESLLLRYSTVEDLESERKRKLAEFDVRVSILRSNMMSMKDQVERQQTRAANIERAGREVPTVIKNNISELEQKLAEAESSLNSMHFEKDSVKERYEQDINQFSTLMQRRGGTADSTDAETNTTIKNNTANSSKY